MSRNPLIREVPPTTWYFRHPRYLRYMSREITSIFIGAYCALLVFGLGALAGGKESYESFLQCLQSPLSIAFNGLAFIAALYHATTWFNATQVAMKIQIGEDFVPGSWITGAHYVVWAVISVIVILLAGVV
jgi:fumarate reductase subunit C